MTIVADDADQSWLSDITAEDEEEPPAESQPRATGGTDEWQEPIPLDAGGALPAFPLSALPSELAEWAEATAVATQTPVDMAAMLSLAVVSSVVAKRFEVQVRPGWIEPLNLYVAIAMEPGERKSSVFRAATAPVLAFERDQAVELRPEVERARARRDILENRYKKAVAKAKSGDGLDAADAETLAQELANTKLPVIPRHFADDVTPERLASLMQEQGGRIGLFSDEGGIFETLSGRYSDGVANLDLVLKGHSGGFYRADRIKRQPVIIKRPALTIGLTVQPDVVQGLTVKRELRGRGLLARFLYAMPESMVGHRSATAPPVPTSVSHAYDRVLGRLMAGIPKLDEDGEIVSTVVQLDPESIEIVNEASRRLEPRLANGADLVGLRDWATKHVGALVRIAGVLSLYEDARGDSFRPSVFSVLKREILLGSISTYLVAHAQAAYAHMGSDGAIGLAKRVLSRATRKASGIFDARDLQRWCNLRKEEVDSAIKTLVEHGYLKPVPRPKGTRGRPPGPAYALNPLATETT